MMIKSGWYNDKSKKSSGFRFDRIGDRMVGSMYCHKERKGLLWFELHSQVDNPLLFKVYRHEGVGFPFATSSSAKEVGEIVLSEKSDNSVECNWSIDADQFYDKNISPLPSGRLIGTYNLTFLLNGE